MKIRVNEVPRNLRNEAVRIFTDAFYDDPLFALAFPDQRQRARLTKLMYEFVVLEMVSELNLTLKGAFIDGHLAGCIIYTTPESKQWNDKMMRAVSEMRKKANDPGMNLIGEFATLNSYKPEGKCCYGNELAVKREYRRQGIAGKLIETMINDCENYSGVKGILLDTANISNIPLYENWGWTLKQTSDFYSIKKYFMWRDNKEK